MAAARARRPLTRVVAVAAICAALVAAIVGAPAGAAADNATGQPDQVLAMADPRPVPGSTVKIASELVSLFKDGAPHDFWVMLTARADNSAARVMSDWAARGTQVAANLREVADESQAPIRALLDERSVAYDSFWISNAIKVSGGSAELATELAKRTEVERVMSPVSYENEEPLPGVEQPRVDDVEWGIASINADDVWAQYGVRGENIVVANVDTGVQYDHPALIRQYRGNLGDGNFDHNYNWYDAWGAGDVPVDFDGHGTLTMGTMVGDDGAGNQIGVAPGATWIAANGCCPTDQALLDSMQWMLEPTDLNRQNPDASKRPHVINNSWGSVIPSNDPFGEDIQQAWNDSGIFGMWGAGNGGPRCSSANSPGSRIVNYSAGAYDNTNTIASFSARGPGQDGEIKPDISAPGVDVRSSIPGGVYDVVSGTSMSAPHTAGTVALLWSVSSALIGDIEATRALLDQSAVDVDDTSCGGTSEDNNVSGEGRLDALAAVAAAPTGDTGTLAGTVADAETGDPVAGATLELSGDVERSVVTDGAGTFEVLVDIGSYDVDVSAFGYVDGHEEVEVEVDTTTTVDIVLTPAESYSLVGRVRDRATGERLPGVTVEVEGSPLVVTTNHSGRYRFPAVPAGTYDVTATGDGCSVSRTKDVVVDGVWPRYAPTFKADERKRFRLGLNTDAAGTSCRTEAAAYVKGDTPLELTGDEVALTVDLPFDFPFYGETYDSAELSTNGHLRFVPTVDSGWSNTLMPDPEGPDGVIGAFWDDLVLDAESTAWTRTDDGSFTVEYRNATFYESTEDRIDVELTLYESGEVLVAYRGIDPAAGRESGDSATVGVENADGTIGLMYAAFEPVLEDGTAIRFLPGR